MKIRTLTIDEERELLTKIANNEFDYLGKGASRLVFDLGDEKVIKVAMGKGGFRQNQVETRAFENYEDYPIATIFAAGRTCLIMEKLNHCGRYDYWTDDELRGSLGIDNDTLDDIIHNLEDINGETSDNYQLGVDTDGNVKAYDYGFERGVDTGYQVSNLSDCISDEEDTESYVRDLMEKLENMDDDNVADFFGEIESDWLEEQRERDLEAEREYDEELVTVRLVDDVEAFLKIGFDWNICVEKKDLMEQVRERIKNMLNPDLEEEVLEENEHMIRVNITRKTERYLPIKYKKVGDEYVACYCLDDAEPENEQYHFCTTA